MAYTIFGGSVSPSVRKVLVCLAEQGVNFEFDRGDPYQRPDDYRRISPLGKIPAFRHDNKTLADPSVICASSQRLHPTRPLHPNARTL